MVAGPEQARMLSDIESSFLDPTSSNNRQREQSSSVQEAFKTQVNSLSEVITSMENPFLDDCPELICLDTRNCASEAVANTVRCIEN